MIHRRLNMTTSDAADAKTLKISAAVDRSTTRRADASMATSHRTGKS